MVVKIKIFVLFAVIVLFSFTSSVIASDTKIDEKSTIKTDVKPKTTTDVKPETTTDIKPAATTNVKPAANIQKQPEIKKAQEVKPEEVKAKNKEIKTVNINKATALELSAGLKKVGPKYAEAIVKYRETNGEFKSPEDIKKVKGIGEKIFEINKDSIVIKD